jgi:hypothetical protein
MELRDSSDFNSEEEKLHSLDFSFSSDSIAITRLVAARMTERLAAKKRIKARLKAID